MAGTRQKGNAGADMTLLHWPIRIQQVAAWQRSWSYQRSYSTSSPVSTGMGEGSGFDSRRRHFISVCNQPP